MRRLLALLPVVALLAACGKSTPKPFTAAGSADCFSAHGFTNVTTKAKDVGLIAGFAENGGLRATAPGGGNVLTVAFAADVAGAASTEQAFRRHASPFYRKRMATIMESSRNAVLVWTTSPSADVLSTAMGCLAP